MAVDRTAVAVFGAIGAVVVALMAVPYLPVLGGLGGTDEPRVVVFDESGERLAAVEVAVAATPQERYRGLSNTTELEAGTGMLFAFPTESNVSFVMRDMNYPLDMVFVGANGEVTTVHSASVPPAGTSEDELERYSGRAKWVLEVPRGWAAEHGVSPGDSVEIER